MPSTLPPLVPQLNLDSQSSNNNLTIQNIHSHNNNTRQTAAGSTSRSKRTINTTARSSIRSLMTKRKPSKMDIQQPSARSTIQPLGSSHQPDRQQLRTSRSSQLSLTSRSQKKAYLLAELQKTNLRMQAITEGVEKREQRQQQQQHHQQQQQQHLRTSRSVPALNMRSSYTRGSPGLALTTSLAPSASLLIAKHKRKDLLKELNATNSRMTELIEQKKWALKMALTKTNNILYQKLEHQRDDRLRNHSLTARNRARQTIQMINDGGKGNVKKSLQNMVPRRRTNKYGLKHVQDSSAISIGSGKGMINGSPFESTYQSQSRFKGATDTGRNRMTAIEQRTTSANKLPQSEFKKFT
jgi:hypothetical protein